MAWGTPTDGGRLVDFQLVSGSPFADKTALDAWGVTNFAELRNGDVVSLAVVGEDTLEWRGVDTPTAYDPDGWIAHAGLTAEEVKALYESNPDTNALVDSKRDILDMLSQDDTNPRKLNLEGSLGISDPGSLDIGDAKLSVAGRAINIVSKSTGNTALILAQIYDKSAGFSDAFVYANANPEDPVTTIDFNDPEGSDTSGTADFSMTASADELLVEMRVKTNQISQQVSFDVTLRFDAVDGPIALRLIGSRTTDDTGLAAIDLPTDENPILLDAGQLVFVHIECDGMEGVQVDVDTFRPNGSVDAVHVVRTEVPKGEDFTEADKTKLTGLPSGAGQPVLAGNSFRFSDGVQRFDGTVFHVDTGLQEIAFSDGTVDIPGVSEKFQEIGQYAVTQYPDGIAFLRVTGYTSVGQGTGDLEGTIVGTVAYDDGGEFTPPNVQVNARLGAITAVLDPETDISYEQARSGSGQTLGDDFSHASVTDARRFTYNLASKVDVDFALSLLSPNKHALGVAGGQPEDARVISAVSRDPDNAANLIVDLAGPITARANTINRLYDVDSEVVRHLIVESGSNAEVSNGTLRLVAGGSGGDGITYEGTTPGNGELLSGTGDSALAKGSGVQLNGAGNVPWASVGENDITLSGSGGALNIRATSDPSGNIGQYKDRTIFIEQTNTFTINLDAIDDFYDNNDGPFFLRFVNLTERIVAVQGITGETVGGVSQYRIQKDASLTVELPASDQKNWPVLAAGNPLRRFDILQTDGNQTYAEDEDLEFICDHLIESGGTNPTLSFGSSSLDCAFYVHFQGAGELSLAGLTNGGGATSTVEGYSVLRPGDLVWVWNTPNDHKYTAIKFGSSEDRAPMFAPDDKPMLDEMWAKPEGDPDDDTTHRIVFDAAWDGVEEFRVLLNGTEVSIGNITAEDSSAQRVAYTVGENTWTTVYAENPSELLVEWQVSEGVDTWRTFYALTLPA